jgi:hypothetical protein
LVSLGLFQRLVVMFIAALLLGLLIVATTDGLTVALRGFLQRVLVGSGGTLGSVLARLL